MPWISSTDGWRSARSNLPRWGNTEPHIPRFGPHPLTLTHTSSHVHTHKHTCIHMDIACTVKNIEKRSWGDGSFRKVSATWLCGPEFDPRYHEKPHEEKGLTATYMASAWTDVRMHTSMHIQHHTQSMHVHMAGGGGERREKEERGKGRERGEIEERVMTSLMGPGVSHSWSSYDMGSTILSTVFLMHATLWQILQGHHINK